ncbi:hypothetical protein GQR58_015886 [Nymphon striatum]|nr:hypothetical protein GQR58_015886 [Nymphon striatum]
MLLIKCPAQFQLLLFTVWVKYLHFIVSFPATGIGFTPTTCKNKRTKKKETPLFKICTKCSWHRNCVAYYLCCLVCCWELFVGYFKGTPYISPILSINRSRNPITFKHQVSSPAQLATNWVNYLHLVCVCPHPNF